MTDQTKTTHRPSVAEDYAHLRLLVEQQGHRDSLSGARSASLNLMLDERHEMVVTTVIHDRRRERFIAITATMVSVISVLAAAFVIIPILLYGVSNGH